MPASSCVKDLTKSVAECYTSRPMHRDPSRMRWEPLDAVDLAPDRDDRHQPDVIAGDDGHAVEVEVADPDPACLTNPQARAEREPDQVGQVCVPGDLLLACHLRVVACAVHPGQETAAFLDGQPSRLRFAFALRFLDPFELADWVARRGFVQYGLLHRPAYDGPRRPPGVRGVSAPLEVGEVRVELGDVAFVDP